jgi:uncharacterized DUF497 family protein
MKFEWDENKNRKNIRKHGIDFADAVEIFRHPILTSLDNRKDYGEDRWCGIGLMKNTVAVVIYLEWDGENRIRLISVRKALQHERKKYEKEIWY